MAGDNTHIKVTTKQRDFIRNAAKRYNRFMGEFAYQCVFFVHKQRYDPYDLQDVKIVEEFKKLKDQMVSFIRTQEKNHIVPMHNKINDMARLVIEYGDIIGDIAASNAQLEADTAPTSDLIQSELIDTHKEQRNELQQLRNALETKNNQLQHLLNGIQEVKKASKSAKGGILVTLTVEQIEEYLSLPS